MSILDTTEVGTIIPFDQFDYDTKADRLVIPISNPAFLRAGEHLAFVPDGFGGVTTDPPPLTMQTYERTPDGWKRVE